MGDIPKISGGHKFATDLEDSAVKALSAGVDMELIGALYKGSLADAIRSGKISTDLVNESARRVLRAKIQLLGLMPPSAPAVTPTPAAADQTAATIRNYKGADDIWAKLVAEGKFSTPENLHRPDADAVLKDPSHEALALKAAQEEIVLLKNENKALPLDRTKINHLLVVGPIAKVKNLGGYSGSPRFAVTAFDGLATYLGADKVTYAQGCDLDKLKPNVKALAEAEEKAKQVDVIVVVVGFTRGQAGENLDRDRLELVGGQETLVEAMQATGKPVIVVLSNGAPVVIPWINDHIPAILETWYGGQSAGTALAQVLFGEVNPGGKLNVTFPRSSGQIPCYYDHYPLTGPINYYRERDDAFVSLGKKPGVAYAFGHGLSYTTFVFDKLKVDRETISEGQTATVTFTIKNNGPVAGDEVAQMYLRQDFTSVVRPVLELKGFQRLCLKPGEEQTVSFPIDFNAIKFWKDGKWVAEPGQIDIHIGSASDDLALHGTVQWK